MASEAEPPSYEDLAEIEDEFGEIDTDIMRKQYELSKSVYAKRREVVSQISTFWPLVLEQAPVEIDQYIQPQDSQLFAESLVNVEISRPEISVGPEQLNISSSSNPRSLRIQFEFNPNEFFDDTVLEKTFWYRRAKDGWTGLVSEPVSIHWKKGKDLTEGLTDLAVALFERRKKTGDMTNTGLPEYTALKKKTEQWNSMNTSFFTWFGWSSARRWVSAEESQKASQEQDERKQRRRRGEKIEVPEPEEDDDTAEDDEPVIFHEAGEELAISFAEDVWPNAIKYFTQAQESDEISDADFEEMDDKEDAEDGDEDDAPIDIRSLVQSKDKGGPRPQHSNGPPSKKQKR